MTRIRPFGLLAAVAVVPLVALAVAGCGNDDNTPTATDGKPASAGSGDGQGGGHRTRQDPRRLSGQDPLPVRAGHGHDEHVLRRVRHGHGRRCE